MLRFARNDNKILTVFLFLCLNHLVYAADIKSPEYLFDQANAFYKENKFDQAISGYNKIIEQGFENGNLYYNLANSYFKKGELGKAILNYERARIFMPSDGDLKSNYDYACSNAGLDKAPNKAIERMFASLGIDFLAVILFILQGAIFLVLIFLTVLSFPRKRESRQIDSPVKQGNDRLRYFRFYKAAIACLVAAFLLAGWSFKRKIDWLNKGAVVIAQEAEAKFEPLEGSTAHFTLKQGSTVEILDTAQVWLKVRRFDGKKAGSRKRM